MKHFKTIAVFTYTSEYTVLEHLFQQEGIQYYFLNETMASVFPFYSNAIGGIKLQVHTNDIAKATQILSKLRQTTNLKIV